MLQFKDKTALVTGASSGLGRDFAKILASWGGHLVLVARRTELLESLQAEILAQFPVRVTCITQDLSQAGAVDALLKQVAQLDVLINNAGYGLFGEALELSFEKQLNMLQLNMASLTELALKSAKKMTAKGGYILNVASIAAFQATPLYGAYGASKAYVLNFSQALQLELKKHGIFVTALCPGITATEFFEVSGQGPSRLQKFGMMSSHEVAQAGLRALANKRALCVPGFINKVSVSLNRLFPRSVQARVAHWLVSH